MRAGGGSASAECRLPFCDLWVDSPAKLFCPGHYDRWVRHGRPDLERFVTDCELVGTAHMRFSDDNWLKLALLTWDNIARIRPR